MVIVKFKVNRTYTAQHWKDSAAGVTDEYGNPFRLIKLRWNRTSNHKNAEYVKTRGFEDAVISGNRSGDIQVKYRQNGSVMWQQPGGVGPFIGEVPQTPLNMRLLASHYGDKLWTIIDQDIDQIVRRMYEEMLKKQPAALQEFNNNRIRSMHTMAIEKDIKAPELPLDVDKLSVTEQNRLNMITKAENDRRSAMLDAKEKGLNEKIADLVGDGVAPVSYTKEYLTGKGMKLITLHKICKSLGVTYGNDDKKPELAQKILEKQAGNAQAVQDKMDGIIGDGLAD